MERVLENMEHAMEYSVSGLVYALVELTFSLNHSETSTCCTSMSKSTDTRSKPLSILALRLQSVSDLFRPICTADRIVSPDCAERCG